MDNYQKYFPLAQVAAEKTGWLPEVIFTQWQVETAHFTSNNFIQNNNIAGQTWTKKMPIASRGTARPASEGGYYIKYTDPVEGYVAFILNSPRYNVVKTKTTAEEQFKSIAACGWAADPEYADVLLSVYKADIRKGYFK